MESCKQPSLMWANAVSGGVESRPRCFLVSASGSYWSPVTEVSSFPVAGLQSPFRNLNDYRRSMPSSSPV